MKITVESKEKVEKEIIYGDIKSGIVFEYETKVVALKLNNGEAVLLNHSSGNAYLNLAIGYKTSPIKRILGRLNEIIVVEE